MSERKRRLSLFKQNGGNHTYLEKLKDEVRQYMESLQATQPPPPDHSKICCVETFQSKECLAIALPDLDNYVKTVEEFFKKHAVAQQQIDQMMRRLENNATNLL